MFDTNNNNNNLTNSYWSIGSTMNVKEDRAQTREMRGMETQFQCGWYVSTLGIDSWHALGERYYLLILWRQLLRLAAIAGQCFGSILKVFNALIIVLPKVISGAPLGLLCGSQEDSRRLHTQHKIVKTENLVYSESTTRKRIYLYLPKRRDVAPGLSREKMLPTAREQTIG